MMMSHWRGSRFPERIHQNCRTVTKKSEKMVISQMEMLLLRTKIETELMCSVRKLKCRLTNAICLFSHDTLYSGITTLYILYLPFVLPKVVTYLIIPYTFFSLKIGLKSRPTFVC